MPFIRTISKKEATGRLREIYGEIGRGADLPPTNLFSVRPDILEAYLRNGLSNMSAPSNLQPRLRQLVAFTVSIANSCPFCFETHGMTLQALGFPKSEYKKLLAESKNIEADDVAREVVEFSRRVTANPGETSREDIGRVRDVLKDEGDFVEVAWTIAYFNFMNRVVNSLGLTFELSARVYKLMKSSFRLGRLNPLALVMAKAASPDPEKFSIKDTEEILQKIRSLYTDKLGFMQVPPFYDSFRLRPIQMDAWANLGNVLLADGGLPLDVKMQIANLVARLESYDWLLNESLKWLSDRGIQGPLTEPSEKGLATQSDEKLERTLRLAQDISLHSYKISEGRIEELRSEGLGDDAILEMVCVASFFSGESRLYRCLVGAKASSN